MTKKYSQLTQVQRYKIEAYIEAGKTQTGIARLLGVSKSTISRELKRNVPQRGVGVKLYIAEKAHIKTCTRRALKNKHTTFSDALKQDVKKWMDEKRFSPDLIAAQWKKENIQGVSHEYIYQFCPLLKSLDTFEV